MNRLKSGLLLALVCLLAACEKEVTSLNLPAPESQLAINAFISPQDTVVEVAVYESKPVFGERPGSVTDLIRDATVTLSDGQRTVALTLPGNVPFASSRNYHVMARDFPIEAGKTYFLRVSTPDGRLVTAQCTVPAAPPVPEMRFNLPVDTSASGTPNYREYTGALHWQDPAGEENFYRVDADINYVRVDNQGTVWDDWRQIYWSDDKSTTFSDARLDGAQFSSPETTFPVVRDYHDSITLYAYLLHTDRAYFEYHRTIRANTDGNPFAEPVLVYSNVEGGLGVFAAFNRTTLEVKLL
jgi:hypothetical protein